jgi:GAF domain
MMNSVWRIVLVSTFTALLLVSIGDLFDGSRISDPGVVLSGVPGASDVYVLQVDTAGEATRAGVRLGDVLRLDERSAASRLSVAVGNGLPPGARIAMTDLRTGRPFTIVMRPDPGIHAPIRIVIVVVKIALEALALFVLLRRGRTRAPRAMAVTVFALLYAFFDASGSYLGVWFRIGYHTIVQEAILAAGCVALVVLAISLVPWPRRLERAFVVTAAVIAVLTWLVSASGYTALMIFGRADVIALLGVRHYHHFALTLLTIAGLAFAVSAARAQGRERRRVAIVGASALLFVVPYLYWNVNASSTGVFPDVMLALALVSQLVGAVGLAYAVFVEQLFDVGFVVNRAVVFGLVSATIVALFMAVEWFVGKQIGTIGRVQGAFIEMAAAVLIGLSLRMIHSRADVLVDRLFFAGRHRDANAVSDFAREVHLFSRRGPLLDGTIDVLRRNARVLSCAIFLADETGALMLARGEANGIVQLDPESRVPLRLRSSRAPVDRSTFPGLDFADVAFPLLVRDTLTGLVSCLLPPHAEPYSPEEMDALTMLAREVATALVALDALDAQRLRLEVDELRARLLAASPASTYRS